MNKLYLRNWREFQSLQSGNPRKLLLALLCYGVIASTALLSTAQAQMAFIDDAWWSYQQDCNGDGCIAGTLSGDLARLNWNPDVTNCNGTLTVFEKVYSKPCASNTWTLLYTTPLHTIIGCRSSDAQFLDVPMAGDCACRDYKIEVYRNGVALPDYVRSSTNDTDLFHHQEQLLVQDFCLSDMFATCASISGPAGSHLDNNSTATKEPGEPDHAGKSGGKSLWYCWTPTNNTTVTFDTLGTSFDTLLAVYTGDSISNLTLIASNDDIDGANNRQSKVSFVPAAGQTYHIAVDGYGGASGVVVLNWDQSGKALPDLIFWGPAVSPYLTTRTFATNDCEVVEGCETAGTHVLLNFNTESRNIGAADLVLGNPATNSLFHWASCHGHYHFEEFAQYDLLDTNGDVVALGHKVGFCLVDDHPWSPSANPSAKYDCNNQGIQAGWADVYGAGLPCQYIDVTAVLPGSYILRLTANPAGLLMEANTDNNVVLVPITIPPVNCISAPANDAFSNAIAVYTIPFTFAEFSECATKETGEPRHAGDSGGHSVWFNWTPTSNHTAVITTKRSDFDTLLGVYTGNTVNSLSVVASNDDITPGDFVQSFVSFPAIAGTTYRIAVDGYAGAVGTVTLNVDPPGNDDFANAYLISGASGSTNGFSIAASKELFEPAHAFDVGGRSIWYRWTAPYSAPVEFNTVGSSFDTTLAIYTGTIVTNLTVVAANNDDVGGAVISRVGFNALAGVTYRIAVDGLQGDSGNAVLNWNMFSQLAISPAPEGQIGVSFTGVNWQRYGLQASSNLITWSTQAMRTMSGGSQQYFDSPSDGPRYYRTVRLP
jgi:hypothetical protein